jgi:hypothetical protein
MGISPVEQPVRAVDPLFGDIPAEQKDKSAEFD